MKSTEFTKMRILINIPHANGPRGAKKAARRTCEVWRAALLWVEDPGDDRLSRQGHYHGPGGLNGRVRDGNGCGPAGVVAGKPTRGRSGPRAGWISSGVRRGVDRACRSWPMSRMRGAMERVSTSGPTPARRAPAHAWCGGGGSGWSSRSAVRTGRLRSSRTVHSRPIDLVVSQEPSQQLLTEAWSRRGLRA